MNIHWSALGSTFAVSTLVTVGVVAVFCLGIAALSRRETAPAGAAATRGGALAVAALSFAACAAAVGYGLYLIAG
ncbi:hypothetical protein [Streptacidiphilus cavernicola]|uniref:Secreted protein n=1 Tax=Streptacidiphilus cavernicola TaxID=3342716 RepID=A0ABV6VU98_9ACTN